MGAELAVHPLDADRLRYRIPAKWLSGEGWRQILWHFRPAILKLLRAGQSLIGEEEQYLLAERLAVAEDLGLNTHPGSPAWLIAQGEALEVTYRTNSLGGDAQER
jgi:hypothetical protein